MTHLLLIKTSSLGDIIHALPAISDLRFYRPNVKVSWLVEEAFQEIPRLHEGVSQVITVSLRRWRRSWSEKTTWQEVMTKICSLRKEDFDLSVDCQGLLKSALLASLAPGTRHGYNRQSIREPLASFFYNKTYTVSWNLHAVERNRQLLSQVFNYAIEPEINYGIRAPALAPQLQPNRPWVMFLHGTSRQSKEWPVDHWITLGRYFSQQGLRVVLPSGNAREKQRAQTLSQHIEGAIALPSLSLTELASFIQEAQCVVGVDTGLTHLAAALQQKVIAIYTDTNPQATGVYGSVKAINVGGISQIPSVESIIERLS